MNTIKKIIMIGAGGHAKVILDIANITNIEISYIVDVKKKLDVEFSSFKHIITDDYIKNEILPNQCFLINALGVVPGNNKLLRSSIYNDYKKKGYKFLKAIHPKAIISNDTIIQEGVNIMAGTVIQPGSLIKENSIINTGVLVDHECIIGRDVHIAPGAILCGNVKIGDRAFIGAGTKIMPNVFVPEDAVINAGSLLK